ncbi:hypothetical protein JXQ31_20125 [candidate division KSB1 bacterium]|nr:hypothetical protein [candidate division KSB1 bacterium]
MVLVKESFLQSTHGTLSCTQCHQGNPATDDMNTAHKDLIAVPSETTDNKCTGCHNDISTTHQSGLHANLAGYYKRIENRLGMDISSDAQVVENFNKECGKCHATCGQCHVSRPVAVNGGFLDGHNFTREPSMRDNCTACHGSRVGAEYFGENTGIKSDVHWIPNVKRCVFCHDANSMHGSSANATYRYEDTDMIRCEDCHINEKDENPYHKTHWEDLSCHVCHSQPYKNCNGCHTGGSGITGSSYITFKIAKNPIPSTNRKYKIVTVRHIPVVRDTYAAWGINDLPNYNAETTWKYATPHNIQKWTAQTDTTGGGPCSSKCHNSDFYLTLEDLDPDEVEANHSIVLTKN